MPKLIHFDRHKITPNVDHNFDIIFFGGIRLVHHNITTILKHIKDRLTVVPCPDDYYITHNTHIQNIYKWCEQNKHALSN